MGRLSVSKLKSLNSPGLYGDGETLYLRVSPTGTKSWIQRIQYDGRRRDLGLGPYPLVTLKMARELATENRLAVLRGLDPLAERQRPKAPTFAVAATQWFDQQATRVKGRSLASARSRVARYAKRIAGVRVDRITTADVLAVLLPLYADKPATGRALRLDMRQTFGYCEAQGFIQRNPAGEAIEQGLPKATANKHHDAMPYSMIGQFLANVAKSRSVSARCAIRFIALTAVRSNEVTGAVWSEIDLDAKVWTIPAERMKQSREHRVPLSRQAVEVLREVEELQDGSGLVFPSTHHGKELSTATLRRIVRQSDHGSTTHGLRTTFRTWVEERTNTPHAVAELALAHSVGSAVERTYQRSDLFDKRRVLMQRWADYATATPGQVVKIA